MNSIPYYQLCTAIIQNTQIEYPTLITPQRTDAEGVTEFLWDLGPANCVARFVDDDSLKVGQARIVRIHGKPPKKPGERHRWHTAIWIDYLKEYHPPIPITPEECPLPVFGWLSPDGTLYSCHYGDHDSLARAIYAVTVARLMNRIEAGDTLAKRWLRLHKNYAFGRTEAYDMTAAQAAVLDQLNTLGAGIEIRERSIH